MWRGPAFLLASLLAGAAMPARAQDRGPLSSPSTRFESWRPELSPTTHPGTLGVQAAAHPPDRMRHALVGGAIGAVGGLVVCTVISNIADDSAGGFSTCTLKGYLLSGSAGFALGFALGWII